MTTLTATIQRIAAGSDIDGIGGYVIRWSDGHYESQADNQQDIRRAQLFTNVVDVWRYLEASYPSNSTWRGQWVDSPDGLGHEFCITVD